MKPAAGPDPSERKELLKMTAAFATGAVVLHLLFGWKGMPIFLGCLSALALLGAAFFRQIGHDIYLLFTLIAMLLGAAVSRIVIAAMYFVGIVCFGSLLKLFGMNRLERDFQRCRAKPTMLVDAPLTDTESFRRQS